MSLGIKRKLEILLAVGFACYIVGSIRLKRKICHFNGEKKGNPIMGCFFYTEKEWDRIADLS